MFNTRLKSLMEAMKAVFVAVALALAWSMAPAVVAQQQEITGAQTAEQKQDAEEAAGEDSVVSPVFKEYKGIVLGVSSDEARKKLGGDEAVKNKQDAFFVSENEMVQLFFDKEEKLQAISLMYMPKSNAPDAKAVLGVDVPPGPDGRIYKLIRYPESGYWVSYNRMAGDAPIVTVTMKKMKTVAAR